MAEMNRAGMDLETALENGGISMPKLWERPSRHFEAHLDPSGAELLGSSLAKAAQGTRPTAVMVWYDHEQSVLGHIVARELSARVIQAYEASGVLGVEGSLRATDRVLIVGDYFSSGPELQQMQALIRNHGAQSIGIATLIGGSALPETGDIPVMSLVWEYHE
ncbi:hypothetical protein [Ornithinimicrobium sp. W1665]|uniref:hypothetical protein n=1 Tax=Ornithinimicrobium sp. W1665 TaxID=3416666 RepID=UPI003CEE2E39